MTQENCWRAERCALTGYTGVAFGLSGEERTMTTIYACGDCATNILAAGGAIDPEVREIGLGHLCEVHPSTLMRQATIALKAPDGYVAPSPVHADPFVAVETETAPSPPWVHASGAPEASVVTPNGFGPVTELATRIACAWWTGHEENTADDLLVSRAVDVARKILALTKGA